MTRASSVPLFPRLALRLVERGARRDLRAIWDYHIGMHRRLAQALDSGAAAFQRETEALRGEIRAAAGEQAPAAAALRPMWQACRRCEAPRGKLLSALDGWSAFVLRERPREWRQVDTLLEQIAGGPARLMAQVLGGDSEAARADTAALGRAIAWTAMLRRLDAHLDEGRMIFAESELEQFRVRAQDLAERRITPAFHDLMWFQARRVRGWLDEAGALRESLPTPGARRFAGALVDWQRELLARMEKGGWGVFAGEIELGRWEAVRLLMRSRGK